MQFSLEEYKKDTFHNDILASIHTYQDLCDKWFNVKHGGNHVLQRRKDKLRKAYAEDCVVAGKGLELGFGLGTSTQVLFDWYPEITLDLIDFNPNNRKIGDILKAQYPERVRNIFINNTSAVLMMPDDYYDFINSSSFFEHLSETDYWGTVEECFRILKPGGRLFVYVDQIAEDQHIRIVPPKQTREELVYIGFNAVTDYLFVKP